MHGFCTLSACDRRGLPTTMVTADASGQTRRREGQLLPLSGHFPRPILNLFADPGDHKPVETVHILKCGLCGTH